ncbi:hypothetical protein HHK36_011955 [Tetracentron sinense]|uniref:Sm domain-containing protein n=1 Tax=Tetracentron sinense TaxID=13715 RepID=A0A835DKY5_TETSI|nr:hypothetical protein HHK36_011955 [Tetracentron sinense]
MPPFEHHRVLEVGVESRSCLDESPLLALKAGLSAWTPVPDLVEGTRTARMSCGRGLEELPVEGHNGHPEEGSEDQHVTGTLKGYDQLLNLVLDEAIEFLRDPDDPLKTTDQTRRLGLIVCRGTAVMLVAPTDGTDEIANPFIQPDGA